MGERWDGLEMRGRLVLVALGCGRRQVTAALDGAAASYEHDHEHERGHDCWQHGGAPEAPPYSRGRPLAPGEPHPEVVRLGVARGERPRRGLVLPVGVHLIRPEELSSDDGAAWFLPPGMIGSLVVDAPCPRCELRFRHPVIGANDRAVLLCCDDRDCAFVWSVRGHRELLYPHERTVIEA